MSYTVLVCLSGGTLKKVGEEALKMINHKIYQQIWVMKFKTITEMKSKK